MDHEQWSPFTASDDDSAAESPFSTPAARAMADSADPSPPRRRRWLFSALLVAVATLVLGGASYVRALYGDPLDAAQAIPAGAPVVVGIDLLHFADEERAQRLVDALEPLVDEAGLPATGGSSLEELEASLEEETGIRFGEDVRPWLGRSLAIGVVDAEALVSEDPTGVILALSVRDEAAARSFVERLPEWFDLGAPQRATVERHEAFGYDAAGESLWLAVGDGVLVAAPDVATLRRAFEAVRGESVVDGADYREAIATLPAERGATVYVDGAAFADVIALDPDAGPADPGFDALAMSVGWAEEGLRMRAVQLADAPDAPQLSPPPLRNHLPADTLVYVGIASDAAAGGDVASQIEDLDPASAQLLADLGRDLLGIDVVEDLIAHLGPAFSLAVLPASAGIPTQGGAAALGVVAGLGVTDPAPVRQAISAVADHLAGQGVAVTDDDGVTRFAVDGEPLLEVTTTDEALILGTAGGVVTQVAAPAASPLEGDLRYSTFDDAVLGDGLNVFVDVVGLAAALDGPESARAVSGIPAFAGAVTVDGRRLVFDAVLQVTTPQGGEALGR